MFEKVNENLLSGAYIMTIINGRLFNFARLKAKTKTSGKLVRELLYIDNAAIMAHSQEDVQDVLLVLILNLTRRSAT